MLLPIELANENGFAGWLILLTAVIAVLAVGGKLYRQFVAPAQAPASDIGTASAPGHGLGLGARSLGRWVAYAVLAVAFSAFGLFLLSIGWSKLAP
jgi:TRAP-type C4-dicarboxylate transport system permease small subunit